MNRYQVASKVIDFSPIAALSIFLGVFVLKSFLLTIGVVAFSLFLSWLLLKMARLSSSLQMRGDFQEFNETLDRMARDLAEVAVKNAISKSSKKRTTARSGVTNKPLPGYSIPKPTSKTTKTVAPKRTSRSPKRA